MMTQPPVDKTVDKTVDKKSVPRFKFIEAILMVHQECGRNHLSRAFGLGPAAASVLMTQYRQICGEGVALDHSKKRTVPTEGFKPLFLTVSADEYLAAAQLMACEPF
jgi:hypothetical protein